jgi:site-specific DNA recombinase
MGIAASAATHRAIGIVRVSQVNGREGDSFASPGEQRDRIAAACDRDGIQLVDCIDELDVSGGSQLDQREGLRRAVETIEAHQANVLVVAHFDRLVRSLRVQDEVVSRVEAAGGRGLALDFGEVTNGSAAQGLSGTMLGAVSEYYRRSIQERSAEAQARAVERGVVPWPNIPPGLRRRDDGRVEADPKTIDVVRDAFRMRSEGATIAEVRAHLAANGIARSYHGAGVMLSDRLYIGQIHFGKLVNLSAHVPVIEPETFQRVQRIRVTRGRKPKSERLLARLDVLRCGTCNGRMVVGTQRQHGRTYPFYRCGHVREDCPRRVTVSAEIAESVVVDAVRAALADLEGRASAEANVHDAETELERAQAELDAGVRAFAILGEDEPSVHAKLLELRDARDRARDQVDQLGGQRAAVVINTVDDWDRLSLDARRALIRATVERVAVGTQGRGANRVTVKLFGQ